MNILFTPMVFMPGAGGTGGTETLDPANTNSHITLSSGNLIATSNTAAGSFIVANSFGLIGHTSGKFYYEVTCTADLGADYDVAVGVDNLLIDTNAAGNGTRSIGTWIGNNASDTSIYGNGNAVQGAINSYPGVGGVVSVAADITGSLIWIRNNGGNWNNSGTANPATGTGGISFSYALGSGNPFYPMVTINYKVIGNACRFNFGQTAYSFTPPAGFGNW